jgi:hypothetical protein
MRWRAGLRVAPQSRSSSHSLGPPSLCLIPSPPPSYTPHASLPTPSYPSPLPPKHPIPAVSSSFVSLSPSPNCLWACPPSPLRRRTTRSSTSSPAASPRSRRASYRKVFLDPYSIFTSRRATPLPVAGGRGGSRAVSDPRREGAAIAERARECTPADAPQRQSTPQPRRAGRHVRRMSVRPYREIRASMRAARARAPLPAVWLMRRVLLVCRGRMVAAAAAQRC